MAVDQLPSRDCLRKLLAYRSETGQLFWNERGPEWFSDNERLTATSQARAWNGRNAGREAFTASDGKGYRQGQVCGYHTTAHRVIWAWLHDEWPECLDHIDGDGTNNRECNLRSVSRAENNRNLARQRGRVQMGVRFHKAAWEAYIQADGRLRHLGRFSSMDEAIAARKVAERDLGFHHNHGRPSPEGRQKRRRGVANNIAA